jgi:hypothetical protein
MLSRIYPEYLLIFNWWPIIVAAIWGVSFDLLVTGIVISIPYQSKYIFVRASVMYCLVLDQTLRRRAYPLRKRPTEYRKQG